MVTAQLLCQVRRPRWLQCRVRLQWPHRGPDRRVLSGREPFCAPALRAVGGHDFLRTAEPIGNSQQGAHGNSLRPKVRDHRCIRFVAGEAIMLFRQRARPAWCYGALSAR